MPAHLADRGAVTRVSRACASWRRVPQVSGRSLDGEDHGRHAAMNLAHRIIVVVSAFSVSAAILAMSTQNQDAASVIADLEQRLAQAWVNHDRAFVEHLLAPDWTVTDPSGRILTKAQVIEETFSSAERKIDAMTVDDVKVRVLGQVAIATGRTRATGSYKGQQASVALRFTDVFHHRDGRWQVVVSQGTIIMPE